MSFSCPSHCMVPVCQTSSNHQLQTSGLRRWKPPGEDPDHGLQRIHDIIERNIEPHPCLPMEPHLFGSVYRHPTTLGVHNLDPHLRSIGKWDRLLKPTVNVHLFTPHARAELLLTARRSFQGCKRASKKHPELDWLDLVCPKMVNLLSYIFTRWFMIMILMFIFRGKIIVILWNWYPMFRHSMALLARFCTRNPWRGWTWCSCPQITPSWQGGLRTGKKQSGSKRNPGKR